MEKKRSHWEKNQMESNTPQNPASQAGARAWRHIHEECGVFGLFSPKTEDVASLAYYGLYALQHRGQESAGIAVNDDGVFSVWRDVGLVSEALPRQRLQNLGLVSIAAGHVRYATTGSDAALNAQPLIINHFKGRMALAHNGNLTNSLELRRAGAREIHMRVSAPPFVAPCYYGTDIDSADNLIANHHSVEEIAGIIGVDSLGYLSLEHVGQLAGTGAEGFCTACFSGGYPTAVPGESQKDRFSQKIGKQHTEGSSL